MADILYGLSHLLLFIRCPDGDDRGVGGGVGGGVGRSVGRIVVLGLRI
jgi:hypothetical protein